MIGVVLDRTLKKVNKNHELDDEEEELLLGGELCTLSPIGTCLSLWEREHLSLNSWSMEMNPGF
jgi:hypothetical protein